MKASEFVAKLKTIATKYKTLYVMGCFGAPMTAANKKRYTQNHSYNKQAARTKMINAASADTFGFDCVCLIKGVLWGWTGDQSKSYGGASYSVNGVPDIGADQMITKCRNVSTTGWADMAVGEAVWCSGHIGVYIGDGLAVECTPRWSNNVQITAVGNIGAKPGYNARTWTKHGKLPYIEYDVAAPATPSTPAHSKTVDELAKEVLDGKWGSGADRKKRLTAAGYDYSAVQARVNALLKAPASTPAPSTPAGNAAGAKAIYDRLLAAIGNAYGVAGLMGNLQAESGLKSTNLQNTYEKKLGLSDAAYTAAVDAGSYKNFVHDSAGYGLAQWTYWSRKQALLDFAKAAGKSIGDALMQVDFVVKELKESYPAVWKVLREAKSVREASDAVLTQYERPANMGESVKANRAAYGAEFYIAYAEKAPATKPSTAPKVDYARSRDESLTGTYTVTASSGLHIRTGAGTGKDSLGILKHGATVKNYGYYSKDAAGTRWLYVISDTSVTGFCSSKYLKKS